MIEKFKKFLKNESLKLKMINILKNNKDNSYLNKAGNVFKIKKSRKKNALSINGGKII